MTERPGDPYRNNHFQVMIDGIETIDFVEVTLPEATAEIVEYREGGDKGAARKLVGAVRYSNLVLRRGVTQSTELFDWWKNIREGVSDRRNVAVVLLDAELNAVKRWTLANAWPCRYAASTLLAVGGAVVVVETLECAVERLDVA